MRLGCKGLALGLLAALTPLAGSAALHAAPRMHVISTDLGPLIDRAALHPSRFAVEVPHAVSSSTTGEWSTTSTRSTWRYAVRIPSAVSMSFRATQVKLPASATLRVTSGEKTYSYSAKDVQRGELWSRIARGDSLTLELVVDTADVDGLRFQLASLQAGYRGLGSGVPHHRRYGVMSQGAAAAANPDCSENWSCNTTATNAGAGQATVAIIIGNTGQCTGVLLNNVPGDGTPYVLTARHCQNGDPNGGSPGAAGNISVYWNAVAACGQPLGEIYDPGIPRQFGATTLVEQQDAWLVRLNEEPVVDDAYFAGWDATGGTFVGGFTPHHALGTKRQFTGWFGQASYHVVPGTTLGVHFESTLWATVNAVGNNSAGSSGSGLFDANGRLQGVVVRGVRASGEQDAGVCPSVSPPAPSMQTATSLSTALSGIFSSTADPQSTTGTVTIQSVLDPGNTGTTVVNGQTIPPVVTLRTDSLSSYVTGRSIKLTWTSKRTQSCTASGGESGDGWGGTVATSGAQDVTSLDGGTITYTVTCTDGQRSATASVQVPWTLAAPNVSIGAISPSAQFNVPNQLLWRSNVRPCTASGGRPGDGWSGAQVPNGTAMVTENTIGDVAYRITCGTGARITSAEVTVTVFPPSAAVVADAATLRLGESVHLRTTTSGLPCTLSGGAAGDGWAGNTTYNGTVVATPSAPGTYTYTITCGSGAHIATSQTSVSFVSGTTAPRVVLTSSATTLPVLSGSVHFNWDSNVRPCSFSVSGPDSMAFTLAPASPLAAWQDSRFTLGEYVYTVSCGNGPSAVQASVTVTYTGTPFLDVFRGGTAAIAGLPFIVQYASNVAPCTFTGGTAGDGWAGTSAQGSGKRTVVAPAAGTYTYIANCGSGALSMQGQATIEVAAEPPRVTLVPDTTAPLVGQPLTLMWSSNVSPCQATGGFAGDGWLGPVATSGSKTITETRPGPHSFGVSCGVPPSNASASVNVRFQTEAPTLTASATSVLANESFTLTWASVDGTNCLGDGGSAGDGWSGSRGSSGSMTFQKQTAGLYTFNMFCGFSLPAQVSVLVRGVPSIGQPGALPASVQLSASAASVNEGTPVTLSWTTANVDTCTASGGGSGNGWSGNVAAGGGSKQVQEAILGRHTYSITCTGSGGATSASANTTVMVNGVTTPPPSSGGGSSGGGGGGGALSAFELALLWSLGLLVLLRQGQVSRASSTCSPASTRGSTAARLIG